MSDVDRAMADMREWACDNLHDSDAGRVCRMLSVVSRHVNDMETENSKLKDFILMMHDCPKAPECEECRRLNDGYACEYIMEELGIEVDDE